MSRAGREYLMDPQPAPRLSATHIHEVWTFVVSNIYLVVNYRVLHNIYNLYTKIDVIFAIFAIVIVYVK